MCIAAIDPSFTRDGPNSVATRHGGILGVAVGADNKTDAGKAVFIRVRRQSGQVVATCLNALATGALPDMITFTPNGRYALVANEGEPDGGTDPEGSISIISTGGPNNIQNLTDADVITADFTAFDAMQATLVAQGIRIIGGGPGFPAPTVATDLEPEYITVSRNSKTAWVTLQENNALAKVDIEAATVTDLLPLGTKDHSIAGNGIDASNEDSSINIQTWPVKGMYQPDAIASYFTNGQTFLVTANEGDARDFEETRVKSEDLDDTAFPDESDLQEDENLGRLRITSENGDSEGDGDFDELFSFGARSFSIWDHNGNLVFDSGDELEQITAALLPTPDSTFNSNDNENSSFDSRSDDKGPEPEGVTVGKIGGRWYAFIGLERVGGIMVYDITDPLAAAFVQYINNRDFAGDPTTDTAGDLAPEGLLFIRKGRAPAFEDGGQMVKEPLLVVTNEVSGSTTIYRVKQVP